MRKILSLVVALLLVASFGYARDIGFPSRGDIFFQSATITNDATENVGHAHIATSPSLIWKVVITSDTANTYVQILDSAGTFNYNTTSALISAKAAPTLGGNKKIKADLGAATASQGYVFEFDPPIKCEEGILAGFTAASESGNSLGAGVNATATIYYTAAE